MTTATFYTDSNTAMTSRPAGVPDPMSDGASGVTAGGLTGASNAGADDNVTGTTALVNHQSVGSLFFFSGLASTIPAGSTINSCTIEVGASYSTTSSGAAYNVSMWQDQSGGLSSSQIGSTQNDQAAPGNNEYLTETLKQFTGYAPTANQLRGANFNVLLCAGRSSLVGCNFILDYVRLVVDWTPPGGNKSHGTVGSVIRTSLLAPIRDIISPDRDFVR